ncbi:DNA damage-regulated autophagy modulator protein 2 [Chironomus tepperi]|uniref:DNA damage-regulated autophagy modulator protein 2 n=1 Tax=Chironomus tepperi TaxID=113505 RepID=UPI00391EFA4B
MSKIYLLPISCFLLFQLTFIITYIASVLQNHVVPDVPYISDSATYSPESCIFGQLINTGCVLLGLTIYIRYRQIIHVTDHHESLKELVDKINKRSLYVGLVSCYGISIVANFQETNVRPMHYVGAFSAFGMGTLYFWYQTIISHRLEPFVSVKRALYRIILSVFCTIFFFIVAICGIISHILFEGTDPRHWYPSDGGWRYHVASSVSEWIVATIFSFYILSFTDEFKFIQFEHPEISFVIFDVEQVDVRMLVESADEEADA